MNHLRIIQSPSFRIVSLILILTLFFPMAQQPQWVRTTSLSRLRDHTQTHTLGTIPLDELSVYRRDLYLKTHNNHTRKTTMPTAGFEPSIPAGKRPHTHTLHRASPGIGLFLTLPSQIRRVFTVAITLHVFQLVLHTFLISAIRVHHARFIVPDLTIKLTVTDTPPAFPMILTWYVTVTPAA
jgi:hypothetical protein